MSVELRKLEIHDYDRVYSLWTASDGIGLSSADQRPAIRSYLDRNPGLSTVAVVGNRIVGAILCGHDGRRGYLHHLAVVPDQRRRGVGRLLVNRSLELLRACGIGKCHIFIVSGNDEGRLFWRSVGFEDRSDIGVSSCPLEKVSESAPPSLQARE